MSFLFEPENLLPYDGIAIYHGVVFEAQEANGICKDLFATIQAANGSFRNLFHNVGRLARRKVVQI